jgi:hypothetical protein
MPIALSTQQKRLIVSGTLLTVGAIAASKSLKQKVCLAALGTLSTSAWCWSLGRHSSTPSRFPTSAELFAASWDWEDRTLSWWCNYEPVLRGDHLRLPQVRNAVEQGKQLDVDDVDFDQASRLVAALWRLPDREGMPERLRDLAERLGPLIDEGEGYKVLPELPFRYKGNEWALRSKWGFRNSGRPGEQATDYFTTWLREHDSSEPRWDLYAGWLLRQPSVPDELISEISQKSQHPGRVLPPHRKPVREDTNSFRLAELIESRTCPPVDLLDRLECELFKTRAPTWEDLVTAAVAQLPEEGPVCLRNLALVSRVWRDATRPWRVIQGHEQLMGMIAPPWMLQASEHPEHQSVSHMLKWLGNPRDYNDIHWTDQVAARLARQVPNLLVGAFESGEFKNLVGAGLFHAIGYHTRDTTHAERIGATLSDPFRPYQLRRLRDGHRESTGRSLEMACLTDDQRAQLEQPIRQLMQLAIDQPWQDD